MSKGRRGASAGWRSWLWCCPCTRCWFDPQSGHILRLRVQSLVGAYREGNQSVFLFLSLLLPLEKKSIKTYPWGKIKIRKEIRVSPYQGTDIKEHVTKESRGRIRTQDPDSRAFPRPRSVHRILTGSSITQTQRAQGPGPQRWRAASPSPPGNWSILYPLSCSTRVTAPSRVPLALGP